MIKLSTSLIYLLITIAVFSCKEEPDENAQNLITVDDTYDVSLQSPANEFGILTGFPINMDLKKYVLMGQTSTYQGGASFASICMKTDSEYLVVATGYSEYSDFANAELINLDLNIDTRQMTEQKIFQKNLAKIQTGGASLLKLNKDTILSFFFGKESNYIIDIYIKKSTDNGLTWSNPEKINTIKNEYQHAAASRAILLSNGRILLPMAIGGTGTQNYVFCYYSDDKGETWTATKLFKMKNNELYEPCIEELETGRLIMTLRNQSGKIIFAFSDDNGLTWIDFLKSNIDSPDAPSVIARVPGTEDLILIWNNNTRIKDYQNRSPLSLAISHDDGKTWDYLFDIENRPNIGAYYPTINFNSEKLLITYTQRNEGDSKANVVYTEILLSNVLN